MELSEQIGEYVKLLNYGVKEHSYRVAQLSYVNSLKFNSKAIAEYCYNLGLAHDLYEDTNIPRDSFKDEMFNNDLLLLTRNEDDTYLNYIQKIMDKKDESFAYIVKLSDIIDHLINRSTLKPSLLERYEKALKILCPELSGIEFDSSNNIVSF